MAGKAKIKKTIKAVGFAPIKSDGSFGGVTWFEHNEAGGREYTASANGETTEIYADGVSVYASDENHGYDISLTLLSVIDDIDACWLGNEISAISGGNLISEYANNVERPRFALMIVEDTVDGMGVTHTWYNCVVSKRPDVSGKTSEASGFDPQFFTVDIMARPMDYSMLVYSRIDRNEYGATQVSLPKGTGLAEFAMRGRGQYGYEDITFNKAFRNDLDTYTFTAPGTEAKITVASPITPNANVIIRQNSTEIDIDEVFDPTAGAISVTVTSKISGSEVTKTYTFTAST